MKPSERIMEIYMAKDNYDTDENNLTQSILDYLDEEYEKSRPKVKIGVPNSSFSNDIKYFKGTVTKKP